MRTQKAEEHPMVLTDKDVWGYVQETSRPQFRSCPSCGSTLGHWHGFYRLNKATVFRKKKCRHCGRAYRAARLDSAFGEVEAWEARWLLRWKEFHEEWLKKQHATDST